MKWFCFWMREQRKRVESAFQELVSVCKVSKPSLKPDDLITLFVIHSVLMCLNWINGLLQATDSHSLTQSARCCPPLLPRLLLPLTHCSLLQCLNAEHQNRVWQIKCTRVSCFSSHPAASSLCFLPGSFSDDDLFNLSTDDTYKPDNSNGKSQG